MRRYLPVMIFGCISVLIAAFPVCAMQSIQGSDGGDLPVDGNDTEFLPVVMVIEGAISTHEEDIKESVFEYKFEKASSDPARQSEIVKERAEELQEVAKKKLSFLEAIMNESNKGKVRLGLYKQMVRETNISIDKISMSSYKLEDTAKKLKSVNRSIDTSMVDSVTADVKKTKKFAQTADDKHFGRDSERNTSDVQQPVSHENASNTGEGKGNESTVSVLSLSSNTTDQSNDDKSKDNKKSTEQ